MYEVFPFTLVTGVDVDRKIRERMEVYDEIYNARRDASINLSFFDKVTKVVIFDWVEGRVDVLGVISHSFRIYSIIENVVIVQVN